MVCERAGGGLLGLVMMSGLLALCPASAFAGPRATELIHLARTTMPDARRGERVYVVECAKCHLGRAEGSNAKAIPALAGQHPSYLVAQLAAFVEFERDDSDMHRFLAGEGVARPQTLADVAEYLGSLPAATPRRGSRGKADAVLLERGKGLYATLCAACHQADASGDEEHFVPTLRGQHQAYLLVQIRRMSHGHRAETSDQLISELDRLTSQDVEAVALYLAHLR